MTDTVFLLDVDNTLLDNDAVIEDLRRHLVEAFGPDCDRRYWEIFEQLRTELGYADYLGALQRYRVEHPRETHVLQISLFLLHYPFASRVYPGAFDAIRALQARGPDRHPLRRRRRLSAAQDRALGPVGGRRRRGARSTFTRSRCSTTSSGAIRPSVT